MLKKAMIVGAYPNLTFGVVHGGPSVYLKYLTNEMSKYIPIHVVSIAHKKSKKYIYIHVNKNLKIHYIYKGRSFSIKAAWYAFLHHKDYSLIHFNGIFPAFVFSFLNVFLRKKMVLTFHGYPSLEAIAHGRIKPNSPQFHFLRWMEKKTAQRADAIIAVDSTIGNWCKETLECNPNKLFIIPNGVDTQLFKTNEKHKNYIHKKYGLNEKIKIILSIRRFSPKNGVENILMSAINYYKKYNPKDIIFLMAGGGPLKDKFIKIIEKNGMQGKIIIEDSIPHHMIPTYYSSASVIINSFTHIPFVKEFSVHSVKDALDQAMPIGTSLTTLEALSMGKPVILSTVGGVYKGVNFDDLGVITSDRNPEELSEAAYILLSNYDMAMEMGKRAREYVKKNRSWKIISKKVLDVYNFVLERRI